MSDIYSVNKLSETIFQINEGSVRCFLCVGSERAMLIDSGYGKGNLKAFVETLTDKPILLVNTHADGDHTGCNASFGETRMHPSEFEYYNSKTPDHGMKLIPLWEGEVIDLGGVKYEVVLIPGHTPGSIALLDRENRLLFGGDSLQKGSILMFGPNRNLHAYIASMEKLQAMSDSFDKIIPSHNRQDVYADVIPMLIDGAKKLLAGELTAEESGRPRPCMLYRYGETAFYY